VQPLFDHHQPRGYQPAVSQGQPLRRKPRIEIANSAEAYMDGRIPIEAINGPFLFTHAGSPAEYGAGPALAIAQGWLWRHESGVYVKFTPAGAELFA
jgi:hypothetical protein